MHVSRVLNRASTHDKLIMLAVPFQWVNHPAGTTCPPRRVWPPPERADQSHILHVGRPMGVAMGGELL